MWDDCYSYDTNANNWRKISSPTQYDYNKLNFTWSLSYDKLVNINEKLYIFFPGSVQVYSEDLDIWTEVTEMPRGIGFTDGNCIVDLGNNDFFIRSTYYSSGHHAFHYKFNIDSNVWTKLPNNINSKVEGTHCVKVDLPDGGAGVMLVLSVRFRIC